LAAISVFLDRWQISVTYTLHQTRAERKAWNKAGLSVSSPERERAEKRAAVASSTYVAFSIGNVIESDMNLKNTVNMRTGEKYALKAASWYQ
jgi:hypothetical protein